MSAASILSVGLPTTTLGREIESTLNMVPATRRQVTVLEANLQSRQAQQPDVQLGRFLPFEPEGAIVEGGHDLAALVAAFDAGLGQRSGQGAEQVTLGAAHETLEDRWHEL